jgi:hypothetical protein
MSIRLGAIGVQKVSAKLLEHGFLVSLPIYDDGYDLVVDWKGKLSRVQVKCTSGSEDHRRNKFKFLAVKGPGFGTVRPKPSANHGVKRTYNRSDCDVLVFYHSIEDAIFIIPTGKLPKTKSVYLDPNSKWRDNWAVLKA